MQLSDIFEDTNPIREASGEVSFQKYLEKLGQLPKWKRRKMWEEIKKKDFTFTGLARMFDLE